MLQDWTLEEWARLDAQEQRWWKFWYRKQCEKLQQSRQQIRDRYS
ncbi:hypothetical protein [Natronolimnobius baerhuensis]|nr:hypothetical protein [Natronolimnobius baerhuensis]